MKIIVEKSSNQIKYGFSDEESIQFDEKGIVTENYRVLDITTENSELIEGVEESPTPLFQGLYKWENFTWKLLWDVQKKVSEVERKCSELLLENPTGTEEEWNDYIEKLNYILDNLMISINPLYVEYPKKP